MSVFPETIPLSSISDFALPKALVRIAQKSGVCPHILLRRIEHELDCSWHVLTRTERAQIILTLIESGVSNLGLTSTSPIFSTSPNKRRPTEEYEMVVDYSQDWGA